jgi:hypothetical protein
MAEVVLRTGLNPGSPDEPVLAVVVDPAGAVGERAVAALGHRGHEGDGAFYLLPADGYAERTLTDGVVTVDIVAYPVALRDFDLADFPDRSATDPGAHRLLRVTGTTGLATLPGATAVFTAPPGEDAAPLILGPAPSLH